MCPLKCASPSRPPLRKRGAAAHPPHFPPCVFQCIVLYYTSRTPGGQIDWRSSGVAVMLPRAFLPVCGAGAQHQHTGMMKLVNMLDLGSSAVRLVGSSPTTRTNLYKKGTSIGMSLLFYQRQKPCGTLRLWDAGRPYRAFAPPSSPPRADFLS